jgi:ribosomal-protein-alanine N-acetyltransferase
MTYGFPKLHGVSVTLREISDKDIQEITQLMTRNVARFLWEVPYPYKRKNAQDFVNTSRSDFKLLRAVNFAIDYHGSYRPNNLLIGTISLKDIDWLTKSANIGYWTGEKYWGKGIGTECVRLVIDYAFSILGLEELCAYVYPTNKGSIRILEKNGLKIKGKVNEYNKLQGRYRISLLYVIQKIGQLTSGISK